MRGYRVRNEDKRDGEEENMHLYARCSERHLISVSSVQYTVSGVYICVVMLDKDGLYHCNADSFTHYSELRFWHVHFFLGQC